MDPSASGSTDMPDENTRRYVHFLMQQWLTENRQEQKELAKKLQLSPPQITKTRRDWANIGSKHVQCAANAFFPTVPDSKRRRHSLQLAAKKWANTQEGMTYMP